MKQYMNKLFVRLQNPKVMVAVISGILLVLGNNGIITVDHANHINQTLDWIFSLLIGLGIFGNPDSHIVQVVPQPNINVQPIVTPIIQSPGSE